MRAYAHAPSYSKPGQILFLYVGNDASGLDAEAYAWCRENIDERGETWSMNRLGDITIYSGDGPNDLAFAFKLRWC